MSARPITALVLAAAIGTCAGRAFAASPAAEPPAGDGASAPAKTKEKPREPFANEHTDPRLPDGPHHEHRHPEHRQFRGDIRDLRVLYRKAKTREERKALRDQMRQRREQFREGKRQRREERRARKKARGGAGTGGGDGLGGGRGDGRGGGADAGADAPAVSQPQPGKKSAKGE